MTTVSKFPLLQLPQKEVLRTIRVMDIYQNLSFSLISKRSKKLVQSLQIKAKCINVTISTSIFVTVCFLDRNTTFSFNNSDKVQKKRLEAPEYVFVDFRPLKRIGFEYSDWLKHIQDIFHNSSIANIAFHPGSSEFCIDKIKEVFGVSKNLFARNTGCFANNLMLFQKFQSIETLNINPHMFEDSKIPFSILQQNYTTLDIGCDNDPGEMTLNELLAINSKFITIEHVRISPQDLNKFIKLWLKGSSPRMEYLKIFRTDFQYDSAVVMKGIKHSEIKQDKEMQVYRMDGTCAKILFDGRSAQIIL